MPLHLDYRPASFDDIIGNDNVVKLLKSILGREEEPPRAWMFHGPSGCGKTTLARIISKELGCNPIATNQDFQEINASEARGIDTAREILRSMRFMPINFENSCRIYLLDEVHQGTKDFQNSLLKALEDTPGHVHFILCTTEPGKLLTTIRNRCSRFEVKRLTKKQMNTLLWGVIEDEGVERDFSHDVVSTLIEEADGCPRDALQSLDQIIDLEPLEMLEAIQLSEASRNQVFDLSRALLKGSWDQVRRVLWNPDTKEFLIDEDPETVRRMVMGYMQKVVLNNEELNARALLVMNCFNDNFFYTGKAGLTKACADTLI